MDRPTVLYILYTMVSAQQTNLLPKNASRNDAIFAQKVYRILVQLAWDPRTTIDPPTTGLETRKKKLGTRCVTVLQ